MAAVWSAIAHLYGTRNHAVPERDFAEYQKFKVGFKNYLAKVKSIVGSDPVGKEAISRRGILALQRMSIDRRYTKAQQDHWIPLTGSLATNLGCRIQFTTSITIANVSWKVEFIEPYLFYFWFLFHIWFVILVLSQGDHASVAFYRDKEDQDGSKMVYRSLFANPYEPLTCAILWIGVRFISCSHAAESLRLIGDIADDSDDMKKRKQTKEHAYGKIYSFRVFVSFF